MYGICTCIWLIFLVNVEFSGILHVGPTKHLNFSRGPKGCHGKYTVCPMGSYWVLRRHTHEVLMGQPNQAVSSEGSIGLGISLSLVLHCSNYRYDIANKMVENG